MEVKISLSANPVTDFTVPRQPEQEGEFPGYFSMLSVSWFEPPCPFCGTELNKGECRCDKYQEALKRLLSRYNEKNLFLRVGNNFSPGFFIEKGMVEMTAVAMPENAFILFDRGTMYVPKIYEERRTWHISSGIIEDGVLSFFMRPDGAQQCYACRISKLSPDFLEAVTREVPVEIYRYSQVMVPNLSCGKRVRIGNYHFEDVETTIEKFSYDAFLAALA